MGQSKVKNQIQTASPIKCLSDDELDTLIEAARSPAEKLRILLMADAGLRVGELVKLKWSVLWYAGDPVGAIELPKEITKNHKSRTIPVTTRLSDCIAEVLQPLNEINRDLLNRHVAHNYGSGEPYSPRQVQRDINYLGQLHLKKRVTPHMLRHTFATRLMRKCPMRTVQILLGHSSLQSTEIYTHPNHTDMQKAIDSLNEKPVTEKQGPQLSSASDRRKE